jgi:MOSC domain-containing protein YiiM
MGGSIIHVNISRGGVPKRPIAAGFVSPLGIEGDVHAHPQVHGGPRKAVLLISSEDIEHLAAQGYPVYPGALGENLTTRGIDFRQLRGGQRWRAGQAVIELTKIRVPCATLDVYGPAIKSEIYDDEVKRGNVMSPKWARSGFYASVIQTGPVRPNDIIALLDQVV